MSVEPSATFTTRCRVVKLPTSDVVSVRSLLSVDQTAKVLNVCPRTVAEAIRLGKLESVRIGRRRLIRPEAVEAFIAAAASEPVTLRGA